MCGGGGGGFTHMCMDVRAANVCLWDGVGVHAHVHVCAQYRMCVLCSLNTGSPSDSINFVIIVISCAFKLKFAIHVLMLDICCTCSIYFILLQALVLSSTTLPMKGKKQQRHLLSQMTATVSSQTKTFFVKLKSSPVSGAH